MVKDLLAEDSKIRSACRAGQLFFNGAEASMVMQWIVNPPPLARLVRSQDAPPINNAPVAQSGLEQWSTKPKVGGSNPSGRTNFNKDKV